MEKSIILSKAAILAFLFIIASCVPFSLAARAAAVAELESEPAPVDDVPPQAHGTGKKCSTVKDCKSTICIDLDRWHPGCVNGTCQCVHDVPPQTEVTEETCSTNEDCKISKCNKRFGWHLQCVNGTCKCVLTEQPQAEPTASAVVTEDETCTTVKDCKRTKCISKLGVHLRCVNGTCKCVHNGLPQAVEKVGCPPSGCYEISCVEGCPERVHGRCQCVDPPGSF